ncbi:MAG: sigma-54-dependent Fis family transcriptional regulator [Chloracidobacterium sp.]|nr:sigma-54-dependent Fis family transcriptional regulator [Chloracidobacterium sp.]
MLYTLQNENVNINYLAKLDFLDLCLLGETGTGKTRTAKLIHSLSPRKNAPFIAVNCAGLAGSLIESELFGYEKGAFTGAISSKQGKFEAANGGTLFLDEIGELEPNIQAKLLKVVEEKSITRVGSNASRPINVRIIYATHRDLSVFREDFRYRIIAHSIHLKPLRERVEEIIPMSQKFIQDFAKRSGVSLKLIPDLKLLTTWPWRGNIRELRNLVEKVCLDAIFTASEAGETVKSTTLTEEIIKQRLVTTSYLEGQSPMSPSSPVPDFMPGDRMELYLERIEQDLLRSALAINNNNQTRAAQQLGISRSGLIKKLKRIAS